MNEYKMQAKAAAEELIAAANLKKGDLLVVGCSTSEIISQKIGTDSAPEIGQAVAEGILEACRAAEVELAAQCCEHLNRALILESAAAKKRGYPICNVLPRPKAGGSFATAVYGLLEAPAAVENIQAQAGLDIGGTLIGMHLQAVAVPYRLKQNKIGDALVLAARTRPKFIGGERAHYCDELK
ncbi:MAG: TIGR01440 family protein [Clostridia bacterium]|nr:TIGR01440 family protein [Clostridia bacterium]